MVGGPRRARARTLRRAWTTEHCLNTIEIPIEPYAADQHVTRTVYDDDSARVDFWENTAAARDRAVEAEIKRGLHYLFPDATIPDPAEDPRPGLAGGLVLAPRRLELHQRRHRRLGRRAAPGGEGLAGRRGVQPAALGLERRRLQVLDQCTLNAQFGFSLPLAATQGTTAPPARRAMAAGLTPACQRRHAPVGPTCHLHRPARPYPRPYRRYPGVFKVIQIARDGPLTCENWIGVDPAGHAAGAWESRGRRFKSCQPRHC